jgi:sugar/nucleoside kinase (ribokinase family)
MDHKAIFIGMSTADHTYLLEEYPAENLKVFSKEYLFQCGGPALNAAVTCNFLGGAAQLISCFGSSKLAVQTMDYLKGNYSLSVNDVTAGSDLVFPVSSILINPNTGSRTVISSPVASPLLKPDYSSAYLTGASVILLDGYYLHPGLRDKILEARADGTKIIMDGGSWKTDSDDYLDLLDYIICSTKFIKPGLDQGGTIRYLHSSGVEFVGYTDNQNPILVSHEGKEKFIPVEQISAIDTLGAGDVLHGAFCHYLSEGYEGFTSLEKASKIATESCRYFGTHQWHKNHSGTE